MTTRLIYTVSTSVLVLSFFTLALPARAQTTTDTTNPNGLPDSALITSCAPKGEKPPQGVGQMSGGGIFVPVNDAAVTANTNQIVFNTGMLEYKECVLREIVDAQRKYVTAVQIARSLSAFQTGRDGNPLYQVNPRTEPLGVTDQETERRLNDGTFDTLDPLLRDPIKRAIRREYARATRKPTDFLSCPYQGDLNAALHNNIPEGSVLSTLWTIASNPACNPIFAKAMAMQALDSYNASALANYYAQLSYGQGIYPRTIINEDGDTIVTTPASLVRSMNEMFLQSGYQQNQHANNVSEMVSGLFANIATQVISSSQGIKSLFQPLNGVSGPSYLTTVIQQAANGITQSHGNAALQVLNAALAVEVAYNQAVSAIANILTQGIGKLRDTEKACWVSLTQNICKAGTLSADGTHCTDMSNNTLTHIATSTQFSQAVVVSQISQLASSTLANLAKSNTAITLLNQIIATIVNNPTPAQQAAAIAQYNKLASQGAFHTQTDVSNVQKQQGAVTTAIADLVQNTTTIWTGTDTNGSPTIPWDQTINPGTGWCNYQNQPTLTLWDVKWK
jgi:hypothetical protein